MGLKNWIIKKLEEELDSSAGHIDLESLSEEERNKCFIRFGEGDKNLTKFLKISYKNGAPSIFCCSGHGVREPYVVLKVTNENIELLRKVGKVLSKKHVFTNFNNNYYKGLSVTYRGFNSSTDWLELASQIIEKPEIFDDSNPDIYYHQEIYEDYKPFAFKLKKKLLNYLRGERKELPTRQKYKSRKKNLTMGTY